MGVVWHRSVDNLAVHELGIVFERHVEVLLGRDLRFRRHLWEAQHGARPPPDFFHLARKSSISTRSEWQERYSRYNVGYPTRSPLRPRPWRNEWLTLLRNLASAPRTR